MGEFFDKWTSRIANALAIWPLVPAGAIAVIFAYLSTGVDWINQYGAFGWFGTGLFAFTLSSAALALLGRARLWRVEAKLREKVAGDGSNFDPMARVYENKRIYLRDLAPIGRRVVKGKKFINCEIVGPGTAILGLRSDENKPFPKIEASETFDVDCIEVDPSVTSNLAIAFPDCDFEQCEFYHMTLLFTFRENETLHWITPDFRQEPLKLDGPDGSKANQ